MVFLSLPFKLISKAQAEMKACDKFELQDFVKDDNNFKLPPEATESVRQPAEALEQ